MASFVGPIQAAAVGSTGNNNHTGVQAGPENDSVAVDFNVEAIGATPTVTFELQGSLDTTNGVDGNWFSVALISPISDTLAVSAVVTTVTHNLYFVKQVGGHERFLAWYRVKTTANTNVTYSARVWFSIPK